jgi:hypothetical protein
LILDCKTYIFSYYSSFSSDHGHISVDLMSVMEGRPKKQGQIYPEKLLDRAQEPTLDNWEAFQAALLCNLNNLASAKVAEYPPHCLKQSKAASSYASDFRIIASTPEWLGAPLMPHSGKESRHKSEAS